jgi:hypothetical protein
MKHLPKGIVADLSNNAYYDTEKAEFYLIEWKENEHGELIAIRHYLSDIEKSRPPEN